MATLFQQDAITTSPLLLIANDLVQATTATKSGLSHDPCNSFWNNCRMVTSLDIILHSIKLACIWSTAGAYPLMARGHKLRTSPCYPLLEFPQQQYS